MTRIAGLGLSHSFNLTFSPKCFRSPQCWAPEYFLTFNWLLSLLLMFFEVDFFTLFCLQCRGRIDHFSQVSGRRKVQKVERVGWFRNGWASRGSLRRIRQRSHSHPCSGGHFASSFLLIFFFSTFSLRSHFGHFTRWQIVLFEQCENLAKIWYLNLCKHSSDMLSNITPVLSLQCPVPSSISVAFSADGHRQPQIRIVLVKHIWTKIFIVWIHNTK